MEGWSCALKFWIVFFWDYGVDLILWLGTLLPFFFFSASILRMVSYLVAYVRCKEWGKRGEEDLKCEYRSRICRVLTSRFPPLYNSVN